MVSFLILHALTNKLSKNLSSDMMTLSSLKTLESSYIAVYRRGSLVIVN